MSDAPASRQTVLQLAESLKSYALKCDQLSQQMSHLELQLARQEGQAMPSKLDALEIRMRFLEESRARLWGAVGLLGFIGVGGIVAILKGM